MVEETKNKNNMSLQLSEKVWVSIYMELQTIHKIDTDSI